MTDLNATVNPSLFRAAARCTSGDQHRPHIQGVLVTPLERGVSLVATDGSILIYVVDPNGTATRQAVIKPPRIKMPAKWKKAQVVTLNGTTVEGADMIEAAPELSEQFPDYKRVLPSEVSGDTAQFDPKYMAILGEIGDMVGVKHPMVWHNGFEPALFEFNVSAFGVLSPLRANHRKDYSYEGLQGRIREVKAG